MSFSLVNATNEFLRRKRFRGHGDCHFYPSEASVITVDEHGDRIVYGGCLRSSYFRCMGEEPSPTSARSESIFELGKNIEKMLVNDWKEMGLYIASSIRFQNPKYNLSGELDVVIRDPELNCPIGVECCTPNSLVVNEDYRLLPLLETTKVIAHTGEESNIINFQESLVKDTDVYRFCSKIDGLHAEFTGEHPILIGKVKIRRLKKDNKRRTYHLTETKWIKAQDVKPNDYICIPKARFGFAKERVFYHRDAMTRYDILADRSTWEHRIKDGKIYSMSKNAFVQETGFPTTISDLASFYWLLGLYIAEGSCGKNTVYFSLHEDETELINRIKDISISLWGLEPTVRSLKGTKCVNVCITSKALRELIKSIVPGNSVEKTKHVYYDRLDKRYLNDLLYGIWQGDGCKDSTHQYKISTSVPHLAYLYFQVAAHLGLHPDLKKYQQQSQLNADYIYVVEWSDGKGTKDNREKLIDGGLFWCYRIKSVETRKYTGEVYNLECDGEHTYTVGGLATHNCKSYYGYNAAKEIQGNRTIAGQPKKNNLLQTLVYANEFKDRLPYFKIFYEERGDGTKTEFDVSIVADEDEEGNIVHRPKLNDEVIFDYTIEDIYGRFDQLQECIVKQIVPDRDFELHYDNDKIEDFHNKGKISDSKYNDFKKVSKRDGSVRYIENKRPGDFQCSYCYYKHICW